MRILYVKVTWTARLLRKLCTPTVIKTEIKWSSYSKQEYGNPGLLVELQRCNIVFCNFPFFPLTSSLAGLDLVESPKEEKPVGVAKTPPPPPLA